MNTKASTAKLPVHVGIIMDGNGRWAQERGMARSQGHLEGLKTARRIVAAASKAGIRYLSLFVFSTENWKRAKDEVDFIMGLVKQHLMRELDFYRQNRIRIRHTGDISGLSAEIARELQQAQRDTKDFDGMQVVLALNYGGRDEIVRAVRRLLDDHFHEAPPDKTQAASGNQCSMPCSITEDVIARHLDNPDIPYPDLIIRTAGEYRTSNFLPWQAAYAEYFISPALWPDWNETFLHEALDAYAGRERRFGAVHAP
ncbi:MAG: di-trans,poly-cis-decaprenylcistransferase [Spirochaetaceae bacterium]|jgi:undecaprenyl diphosphate synthase|nr:di-trans,poly-cis-decaprenylcistransferase [Spirochaetaceae bacterium]